jgi:hypothetical protein
MRRIVACLGITLLGLALGACVNDDFQGGPGIPNANDEDGDGYTKDVDCDDKDPDVYPGAPERDNCKDDNCDGQIDEGTANWDKDHDGYCPSTGDIGDCEGNPKRHPGMSEDGGDGSGKPNGIDDNCNGVVDEGLPTSDVDKDGFTIADGDCNDNDPYINPGAVEVEGMKCKDSTECPNGKCFDGYCRCLDSSDCSSAAACTKSEDCKFGGETCKGNKCVTTFVCLPAQTGMPNPGLKVCRDNTDNDCDKKIDEVPEPCDDPAVVKQTDPYDYARAIELCDTDSACGVDGKCPGALKCVNSKCTRVLSASFNTGSSPQSRAIAATFAKSAAFTPKAGKAFAILSTGLAVYDPKASEEQCPQSGTDFGNVGTDPDPKSTDKEANDIVVLSLEILVPTNAQSFDFDFHFFSTEYPEYVGTSYNDTFWVQLQSQKFNGNISFDKNGIPIRINNSFFDICDPYAPLPQTKTMCSQPSTLLIGTGYADDCIYSMGMANGGSTGWLHTTSPVTPGEVIKLSFYIFDKGDGILDSAVLIDNFRWKLTPATKPLTGPE